MNTYINFSNYEIALKHGKNSLFLLFTGRDHFSSTSSSLESGIFGQELCHFQGNCQVKTVGTMNIRNADHYGYFNFDVLVTDTSINGVQHTATVAVSVKVRLT